MSAGICSASGRLARLLLTVACAGLLGVPAGAAPSPGAQAPAQVGAVPPLQTYVFAVETSAPGSDPRCPQFYGYVLDVYGRIYRYDDTCVYGSIPVPAPDGLQTVGDLDDRYAFRRVLVGHIDPQEVRRRAAVILPASWGTLRPQTLDWTSAATQASSGQLDSAHITRTFIAYSYQPGKNLCRRVPLRVIGAHNASSNSEAAAELADWLNGVIDPDTRDAGIARDLAALPVESLDAGCSGGIAGGSSRIVIGASGVVTVSDTRRTHPRGERIWSIPSSAAGTLLEEATHDRLMQRDLRGGTPDDACWLGVTTGAVRHELSWNGASPELPADVRHLFESIETVAARSPPCPKSQASPVDFAGASHRTEARSTARQPGTIGNPG
jgi:hypothetical protein